MESSRYIAWYNSMSRRWHIRISTSEKGRDGGVRIGKVVGFDKPYLRYSECIAAIDRIERGQQHTMVRTLAGAYPATVV